jgi:hypothetical protein
MTHALAPSTSTAFLRALVDSLPACSFAMAYGSAVFRQKGYSASGAWLLLTRPQWLCGGTPCVLLLCWRVASSRIIVGRQPMARPWPPCAQLVLA